MTPIPLPTPWMCVRDSDDEFVNVWRAFQVRDYARDCMRPLQAEIAALKLAEEGADEAFAHVVQQKIDAYAECRTLQGLLAAAYADIRRLRKETP